MTRLVKNVTKVVGPVTDLTRMTAQAAKMDMKVKIAKLLVCAKPGTKRQSKETIFTLFGRLRPTIHASNARKASMGRSANTPAILYVAHVLEQAMNNVLPAI